ncbi:hypothetical protein Vafri_17670 [Volvox africanus]|uniref:Uncharacterized protein n=1 Tax=Volvox africanus TaxID=51714 RepID=A0A8J4BLI5_9CHLO|nr:hypothetical protein Vafri_17670 [Volvox africanus]
MGKVEVPSEVAFARHGAADMGRPRIPPCRTDHTWSDSFLPQPAADAMPATSCSTSRIMDSRMAGRRTVIVVCANELVSEPTRGVYGGSGSPSEVPSLERSSAGIPARPANSSAASTVVVAVVGSGAVLERMSFIRPDVHVGAVRTDGCERGGRQLRRHKAGTGKVEGDTKADRLGELPEDPACRTFVHRLSVPDLNAAAANPGGPVTRIGAVEPCFTATNARLLGSN